MLLKISSFVKITSHSEEYGDVFDINFLFFLSDFVRQKQNVCNVNPNVDADTEVSIPRFPNAQKSTAIKKSWHRYRYRYSNIDFVATYKLGACNFVRKEMAKISQINCLKF